MINKTETINRLGTCSENKVAVTNFGMAIAEINGILDRVMEIFKKE